MSLSYFVGDIHNHCGISYGEGTLLQALTNARAQLDFASVTGHAWWHDMDRLDGLEESKRVHSDGFQRLAAQWDEVLDTVNDHNSDGEFVTYPSFEWHSLAHGDRCIYYRDGTGPILRSNSLEELYKDLDALRGRGIEAFALPHHTAYGRDNRGFKWDELDEVYNPIVEIVSTHGAADLDVDRPYLLPIGPRDFGGSLQEGLASGRLFGVAGSTDNHAGFPGSYDFGKLGVWAPELTRREIWEAIRSRRTVAMTGHRVEMSFHGNDTPMGSKVAGASEVEFVASVKTNAVIDSIDLLRNGVVVERDAVTGSLPGEGKVFVPIWMGWGRERPVSWDLGVSVSGGAIVNAEPHMRGPLHVDPQSERGADLSAAGSCELVDGQVRFRTTTVGNASPIENGTQGLTVELSTSAHTVLHLDLGNDQRIRVPLGEVLFGEKSIRVDRYAGPCIQVGPAIPFQQAHRTSVFRVDGNEPASFLARVRLRNGHWAWSSPILTTAI